MSAAVLSSVHSSHDAEERRSRLRAGKPRSRHQRPTATLEQEGTSAAAGPHTTHSPFSASALLNCGMVMSVLSGQSASRPLTNVASVTSWCRRPHSLASLLPSLRPPRKLAMAVIKKRLSATATHVEHVVRELARVAEREELAVDLLKLVLVQLARGAVLEEALVLDVSCRASMGAYPLLEFLDVSLALSS